MNLSPEQWVALVVATSFAAGLNVYATVIALGLLARAGLLDLPGSLEVVTNWWVIGVSGSLFAVEFVADKIPGVDLLWNALQTFIRVPAGAVLAYAATTPISPGGQVVATMAGGLLALAAHGGKMAARTAVTASPEPFSNFALSVAEDALAVFLVWFATRHPYVTAAIVCILLVVIGFVIRWVVRALRALFRGAVRQIGRRRPA